MLSAVPTTASLNVGCETSCAVDTDENPEEVTTGLTNAAEGTYASVDWNGSWHRFPPKKRYRFMHGLGAIPRNVETWVGFNDRPLGHAGVGNAAEAAGDIVIFETVTPEFIQLRNGTCETFYLRVYASDPEGASGEGGANGDGGASGNGNDVAESGFGGQLE